MTKIRGLYVLLIGVYAFVAAIATLVASTPAYQFTSCEVYNPEGIDCFGTGLTPARLAMLWIPVLLLAVPLVVRRRAR